MAHLKKLTLIKADEVTENITTDWLPVLAEYKNPILVTRCGERTAGQFVVTVEHAAYPDEQSKVTLDASATIDTSDTTDYQTPSVSTIYRYVRAVLVVTGSTDIADVSCELFFE